MSYHGYILLKTNMGYERQGQKVQLVGREEGGDAEIESLILWLAMLDCKRMSGGGIVAARLFVKRVCPVQITMLYSSL